MKSARKIVRKDDKLIEEITKTITKRDDGLYEYTSDAVNVVKKCANNPLYFFQHFIKIVNPNEGEINFNAHSFQRDVIRSIHKNKRVLGVMNRQCGKTTIILMYALWDALFNEFQNVQIVASKERMGKYMMDILNNMYNSLPNWIKPERDEWTRDYVRFKNGSRIGIIAPSLSQHDVLGMSMRGMSVDSLYMDEFDFIDEEALDYFWACVYPCISSSARSKLVMLTTPNPKKPSDSLLRKLYFGENVFKKIKITCYDMDFRDEKWVKETKEMVGADHFANEFLLEGF